MPSGYLPIFIFLALAIVFPLVVIVAAKMIRRAAPSSIKLETYQCGIKPSSDSAAATPCIFRLSPSAWWFSDVETVFLFP
jgi:NADH-quinone oxidoreductase subunit A